MLIIISVYLFDYGCADIKSGHAYVTGEEGYRQDSDLQKAKVSREALTQLSKLVEFRVSTGYVFLSDFPVIILKLNSFLH